MARTERDAQSALASGPEVWSGWPDTYAYGDDPVRVEERPQFKRRYAWTALAIIVAPWVMVAIVATLAVRCSS
jgi:hypothetical protein